MTLKAAMFVLASVPVLGITAAQAADLTAAAADVTPASVLPWDAFISAGVGYTWFDVDGTPPGFDIDGVAADLRSSAAYTFENNLGVQGDLAFNYQDIGISGVPFSVDTKAFDAVGHLFYREPNSWLVGGLVQYSVSTFSLDVFQYDIDRYYAAAEGQVYLGDVTLYGQAGWQRQTLMDVDADGGFAALQLRYFVSPNWKIDATAGYSTVSFNDVDINSTSWTLGAGTEYRFASTPFSAFAKYDYVHGEFGPAETSSSRVLVGLKLNLGQDTLIARDRSGASLDPVLARPDTGFLMVVGP